ncbi:MAG: TraB/VirB10 family protein [Sulfuricaulis sp.]
MASSNDSRSWREKWASLPPKRKQQITTFGALAAVLAFAFALITSGGGGSSQHSAQQKIANELLPKDSARDLGMTGVAKDVDTMRMDMQRKDEQIAKLQGQVQQMGRQNGKGTSVDPAVQNELKQLHEQIEEMRKHQGGGSASVAAGPVNPAMLEGPARAPIARGGGPTGPMVGPMAGPQQGGASPMPSPFGAIRTIDSAGDINNAGVPAAPVVPAKASNQVETVPTQYIPSGSILTGVIITGLDAPTGKNAIRDPVPVLVRIKHDAILPNRYSSDVKECFLLASGHGDLASERAYLRAESVSCIRNDKKVIDIKVEAFAVGADGKAGVRGRLVSKQGQLIAKASLAGIAQGFATAFQGSRYQFNPQQPDYGLAAQGGVIGGVGSAFDRISKYYLDLADQIFPVIEIDAGQKISFVMVKGESMGVLK